MFTAASAFIHAFFIDELAFRRWVRGLLAAAAPIAVQVVADPTWPTWTFRQWVIHSVPSVIGFAAGSMQSSSKKPNGNGQ